MLGFRIRAFNAQFQRIGPNRSRSITLIAITGKSYRVKEAPGVKKTAEVQPIFDRRGRELRLAARPRLVLAL